MAEYILVFWAQIIPNYILLRPKMEKRVFLEEKIGSFNRCDYFFFFCLNHHFHLIPCIAASMGRSIYLSNGLKISIFQVQNFVDGIFYYSAQWSGLTCWFLLLLSLLKIRDLFSVPSYLICMCSIYIKHVF